MVIPITLVFTKPVSHLHQQPSTCSRRTLHISVIRIPWYWIMRWLSHQRNFRDCASDRSRLSPGRLSLQHFLIHYQRTPLLCSYSLRELLNGRQIDVLILSPAHQVLLAICSLLRSMSRQTPKMDTCGGHQSTRSSFCLCQSLPKRANMAEACWAAKSQQRMWEQVKPQLH